MIKTVRITNAAMANLTVLRRLLPRYTPADIVTEALRAYREQLESQPPPEPVKQSAADSIHELFGD